MEVGGTANWDGGRFDLALFQNVISNRITPVTLSRSARRSSQQQQNNPGDIVVQGLEFQTEASVIRTLGLKVPETWNWNVFGNGYYNFKMIDYGAPPAFGTGHRHAHQPVRARDRHALRPGRHRDAVELPGARHPARTDVVQHRGSPEPAALPGPDPQLDGLPQGAVLGLEHARRARGQEGVQGVRRDEQHLRRQRIIRSSSASTARRAATTLSCRTAPAATRCRAAR